MYCMITLHFLKTIFVDWHTTSNMIWKCVNRYLLGLWLFLLRRFWTQVILWLIGNNLLAEKYVNYPVTQCWFITDVIANSGRQESRFFPE